MLSVYNIWTVAKFEIKTLSRSWFLRIFAGLSFALIFFFSLFIFTDITGDAVPRFFYGMTAAIPYMTLIMFNLPQAIITIFLASDFLKRDKKLDTTEAIYIRSMTNSDYVLGKYFGLMFIFTILNVIFLLMAFIFNVINTDSIVNLSLYFYYYLLISVPALVFITGLSFLLMTVIKNQAVTFILLLGYVGTTLFYLGGKAHNLFDYIGFYIPLMYSDFVGFGNLEELILLRGSYFLLGLSFIFFTVFMFRRLPQSYGMKRLSAIVSVLFFISGLAGIFVLYNNEASGQSLREEMVVLNNKYVAQPAVNIGECNISLEHTGKNINCKATLKVVNNTNSVINKIIINLNPGLKIRGISSQGNRLEHERELHLVFIHTKQSLNPGSELFLEIEYGGNIDEQASYIDINPDRRSKLNRVGPFFIADKRFAFIEKNYVLLTWENMWYPKAGVTYSTKEQFNNQTDFTDFTLNVKADQSFEVISQGNKSIKTDGTIEFINDQPLPKLSLIIGDYERRSVKVDSINFNLYTAENHNYFENSLDELNDTLVAVIKELKQDYERELNLEYPFDSFSLVEAPIQYYGYDRIWTSAQENNHPQVSLLPEQAIILDEADFKRRLRNQERWGNRGNQVILPKERQTTVLKQFVKKILFEGTITTRLAGRSERKNPYRIFPNYYSYTNSLYSNQVSVFNKIFESYVDANDNVPTTVFSRFREGVTPTEQAVQKLYNKPLSEIIADTTYNKHIPELLRLKGDYLFAMLELKLTKPVISEVTRKVLTENRFTNSGYEMFLSELLNEYGIDLSELLNELFFTKSLPGYYITGVEGYKVIDEGRERYQTKFVISNLEPVDGLVRLRFETRRGGPGGGRGFGRFRERQDEQPLAEKIIAVDANQSKEIYTALDESPGRMTVNTILSKNLPLEMSFTFEEFEESRKLTAIEGETLLDSFNAFGSFDEIIVDNENKGFHLTKTEQTSMLKRLLKLGEDEEKYIGLNGWNPPDNFRANITTEAFGKYVHSIHYTEAGDGNIKVSWNTAIESSGYYDVYTFIPKLRIPGRRGRENKVVHNYIIYNDDGEDKISIDIETADKGWNMLGSYYLSGDSAKVELTNESREGIVIADAVKWVKRR